MAEPNTAADPSVPVVAEPPSAPETAATDPTYAPEQDEAGAMAILRAAREAKAGAKSAPEAAPTPAAEPETAAPPEPAKPAPAADAGDEKLARLFERVSNMERERLTERAELEKLRAARAEDEKLWANFRQDPESLFKRVGWDPETIKDYIVNGKTSSRVAQSESDRKLAELEKKLAGWEESLKAREAQAQADAFRASIPAQLSKGQYPYAQAFFDSPDEFAAQVHAVIANGVQQGVQLSVPEAASAVEQSLADHDKRLSRARSKSPAPAAAAAPKPVIPPLTNASTAPASAVAPPTEPDPSDARAALEAARQALRNARANARAQA